MAEVDEADLNDMWRYKRYNTAGHTFDELLEDGLIHPDHRAAYEEAATWGDGDSLLDVEFPRLDPAAALTERLITRGLPGPEIAARCTKLRAEYRRLEQEGKLTPDAVKRLTVALDY